jgi:hypothetical protein
VSARGSLSIGRLKLQPSLRCVIERKIVNFEVELVVSCEMGDGERKWRMETNKGFFWREGCYFCAMWNSEYKKKKKDEYEYEKYETQQNMKKRTMKHNTTNITKQVGYWIGEHPL